MGIFDINTFVDNVFLTINWNLKRFTFYQSFFGLLDKNKKNKNKKFFLNMK